MFNLLKYIISLLPASCFFTFSLNLYIKILFPTKIPAKKTGYGRTGRWQKRCTDSTIALQLLVIVSVIDEGGW